MSGALLSHGAKLNSSARTADPTCLQGWDSRIRVYSGPASASLYPSMQPVLPACGATAPALPTVSSLLPCFHAPCLPWHPTPCMLCGCWHAAAATTLMVLLQYIGPCWHGILRPSTQAVSPRIAKPSLTPNPSQPHTAQSNCLRAPLPLFPLAPQSAVANNQCRMTLTVTRSAQNAGTLGAFPQGSAGAHLPAWLAPFLVNNLRGRNGRAKTRRVWCQVACASSLPLL